MGCRIIRLPRSRKLALRLQWKLDGRSIRSQESLGITDSPRNQAVVKRDIADPIAAEIRAKRFDRQRYLEWFPSGAKAQQFRRDLHHRPGMPAPAPEVVTVGGYYPGWVARQVPPHVRPAQRRDYRQHMTRYILPSMAPYRLDELTTAHLADLRARLSAQPKRRGGTLSMKTVRNVIDGTFRALYRDARNEHLVTGDPFAALTWQRPRRPEPDPFEEDERDSIIDWYGAYHAGHYGPFIETLFLTGMRPSEAVALRIADVDLRRAVVRISKSRYLKHEAATKTGASDRTIPIGPDLVERLRPLLDGRARADYLFTNLRGGPIDQAEWPKDHWRRCLKALGLRHRKWYATRHTFISLALTAGANLLGVAEYCGTSVQMIQSSYGRYMPADRREILNYIGGQRGAKTGISGEAKTQPVRSAVAFWAEKPLWNKASPTGFEPVLPT